MSFSYNRFSNKSIENQWGEYYQTRSYINNIDEILTHNRKELQFSINNGSEDQNKALQHVCGSINEGFAEVSKYLQDINYNISELRGEINAMASMLDWHLSTLVELQRITNALLGNIARLLCIPDSQKQRVYHIEKGLKYLKSAIPDGNNSEYYIDSMESFKEAEKIERKDYITLNRIGQIYLYSKKFFNIPLAKEYFLRSAREAMVEANAGGTTTSINLKPYGQLSLVYSNDPFKAAAAEAYIYASRCCYLEQNISEASELAFKSFSLIPEFFEAGFEHAKYLAANNQETEAAKVLETVINNDRFFSIKTLSDQDLVSKSAILKLLESLKINTLFEAKEKLNDCQQIIKPGSKAEPILNEIQNHISKNTFLSGKKALDLLEANHSLPLNYHSLDYSNEKVKTDIRVVSLKIFDFIKEENKNKLGRIKLRNNALNYIYTWRIIPGALVGAALGFVIGFFRGCSISKFSMDSGIWFGTLSICALIGAIIGLLIALFTDPESP